MTGKYDAEARAADREAKKEELRKMTDEKVAAFKESPSVLAEFVAFSAGFHRYSNRNRILIEAQRPHATFVASYKKWADDGFPVTKGEKGIAVFVPVSVKYAALADGSTVPLSGLSKDEKMRLPAQGAEIKEALYFKIGHVFDISQTSCPPSEYPRFFHPGFPSERHGALYGILKSHCLAQGVAVEESDVKSIALRGWFSFDEKKIVISDKLADTGKLSTLIHEFSHCILLKNGDAATLPTCVNEFEADALSLMIESSLGIQTETSRVRHMHKHWKEMLSLDGGKSEAAVLDASADKVAGVFADIETDLMHRIGSGQTAGSEAEFTPCPAPSFRRQIRETASGEFGAEM
jgi:hypothetical protein